MKFNLVQMQDFYERFLTVESIAEPILSVPCSESTEVAREIIDTNHFDVLGLMDHMGRIVGYIDAHCTGDEICERYCKTFKIDDLVSLHTPLKDCILLMRDKQRLFVLGTKGVEGIITLADLHKQPIRMLLFSLISLLEMSLVGFIRGRYPGEKWQEKLTNGRLDNARELYEERVKTNQDISLLECLQFSDKSDIILKDGIWNESFESKNQAIEFFKSLRKLRDNLAHSNEQIWSNIPEIIDLLKKTEDILEISIGALKETQIAVHQNS